MRLSYFCKKGFLKTFHNINNFKRSNRTIVTLGTFDGVHLGHKTILEKLKYLGQKEHLETVVLTFFPHPRMVLQQDNNIKLLSTIKEKIKLIESIGIESLIIHPFDKEFSRLTAEEFVKNILVEKLNIKKIIIGYDHRFGRNRTATIEDLIEFGKTYDFEVEQISAEEINDVTISSTKIRNALYEGNITYANKLLGYSYSISGKVIHGNQIGRTLGFPTANINVEEEYKLIPKNGVYMVSSYIHNKLVYGMMNIGNKPTFTNNEFSLEVHFFDINTNLYDSFLTITLIDRIRDEKKFENLVELKNQIEQDKLFCKLFLKQLNEKSAL